MEKKKSTPTLTHPLISCGVREIDLLSYIINSNGLINIKGYSRDKNIDRSRVYEVLAKLKSKKLIYYEKPRNSVATDKGIQFFRGRQTNRTVCAGGLGEKSIIRDHKFTFEIRVFEFPHNWKSGKVAYFDREATQTSLHNFSKNNDLVFTEFPDDVGITISTTKVLIKPRNIFGNSHTITTEKAIIKAFEVITLLRGKGFKLTDSKNTLNLIQKEGHYAEVKSILAQVFEKYFKKFAVIDSSGKKLYYLDYSNGTLEDETEDELSRLRVERYMKDIMKNDLPKISELACDIENLKEITTSLIRLQVLKNKNISDNFPQETKGSRIDYIG